MLDLFTVFTRGGVVLWEYRAEGAGAATGAAGTAGASSSAGGAAGVLPDPVPVPVSASGPTLAEVFSSSGSGASSSSSPPPPPSPAPGACVDSLLRSVLVEARDGGRGATSVAGGGGPVAPAHVFGAFAARWLFANEFGLIFVCVYQKILTLLWIEDLLLCVRERFLALFGALLHNGGGPAACGPPSHGMYVPDTFEPFRRVFRAKLREVEEHARERKAQGAQRLPRRFEETKKGREVSEAQRERAAAVAGGAPGKKKKKKKKNRKGKGKGNGAGQQQQQQQPGQEQHASDDDDVDGDDCGGDDGPDDDHDSADAAAAAAGARDGQEEEGAPPAADGAAVGVPPPGAGEDRATALPAVGLSEEEIRARILRSKARRGAGGAARGRRGASGIPGLGGTRGRAPGRDRGDGALALAQKDKEMRQWGDRALTKEEAARLDRSHDAAAPPPLGDASVVLPHMTLGRVDLDDDVWTRGAGGGGGGGDDDEDDEDADADADAWDSGGKDAGDEPGSAKEGARAGRISGFFRSLIGSQPLTADDVAPALERFRVHLMEKNVASDVAARLCDSISASLVGKKLGSFTTVRSTVREALSEALVRILTPRRHIDVLRDARNARASGRPYVAVFCGVNGVGKSTNLAKVCSWLKQEGMSVMISACDTFRSGAVEQLAVHARRLAVPLFERGYRSDPTTVAADAIRFARERHIDVVLIDTAGRMQDNEPLMRALSKLVNTNAPDLVLFVGEALVGNDGVDQLLKFNQAMMDCATTSNQHTIDGIILTKFDTIDDKVGAAISMVYCSSIPIVFLGVGQNYCDLRRLNPPAVARALLRGL